MGVCSSSPELTDQNNANSKIEAEISKSKKEDKEKIKVLLLGTFLHLIK